MAKVGLGDALRVQPLQDARKNVGGVPHGGGVVLPLGLLDVDPEVGVGAGQIEAGPLLAVEDLRLLESLDHPVERGLDGGILHPGGAPFVDRQEQVTDGFQRAPRVPEKNLGIMPLMVGAGVEKLDDSPFVVGNGPLRVAGKGGGGWGGHDGENLYRRAAPEVRPGPVPRRPRGIAPGASSSAGGCGETDDPADAAGAGRTGAAGSASGAIRTRDRQLRRLLLCPLSYGGPVDGYLGRRGPVYVGAQPRGPRRMR